MRRTVVGSLIIAVLALVSACSDSTETPASGSEQGAAEPSTADGETPSDADGSSSPADAVRPEGFTTVTVRVTEADGEVCEVCVWLADDAEERARGLMGVTDLGEPVGMVFRFDELRAGGFWMFQTPTPLSIAWFGAGGELVGTADMDPCVEVPDDGCPSYAPDGVYDLALEVFEGDLEGLGIGPGARLEVVAGTESPTCA